jgi:hypothetical protein
VRRSGVECGSPLSSLRFDRNEARNRLTSARDDDLLAGRGAHEQTRQVGLGFMNAESAHTHQIRLSG